VLNDKLVPGDEGDHYAYDPGEAWAETYAWLTFAGTMPKAATRRSFTFTLTVDGAIGFQLSGVRDRLRDQAREGDGPGGPAVGEREVRGQDDVRGLACVFLAIAFWLR